MALKNFAFKILTTDIEPIVKFSKNNGRIVVVKKN